MNDNSLDPFEQGLLTELRREVVERGSLRQRAPVRRRLKVATSAAAATALAVAGGLLLRPDAAFAVEDRDDGDIVVTITELSDADGLEDALAEHGVTADVSYRDDALIGGDVDDPPPPVGSGSQDDGAPSLTEAEAEGGSAAKSKRDAPSGPCTVAVKVTDDALTFTIDGDAVDPEKVLTIDLAGSTVAESMMVAISWTGPGCTV